MNEMNELKLSTKTIDNLHKQKNLHQSSTYQYEWLSHSPLSHTQTHMTPL